MTTTTSITAIRPTLSSEFIPHKMTSTGTTVSAATKNPDVIYEVGSFHREDGKDKFYEVDYSTAIQLSFRQLADSCTAEI